MNTEYEYSFKTKDIKEYINYCINNNYEFIEEYHQIRKLFKNGGNIMARITKNTYKDSEEETLDFKDDNLNNKVLSVSRESKDLVINDTNREFVYSLLEILDLNDVKVLERKRVVYKKDNVKFEIDDYKEPKMKVIAIEGLKDEVDLVYKELSSLIEKTKVDD